MQRALRATAWILVVSLVQTVSASDWPTYMHDNTRVGHTTDTLAAPLAERWVYSAAVAPEQAWPEFEGKMIEGKELLHRITFDDALHVAIAGGKGYFGSSVDNRVYCVEMATGDILWSRFTAGPVRLAPTYHQGRIYFGSDDGFVYCLRADNGDEVWKLRAGPHDERILARGRMTSRWAVRTGVMIDDDVAYFGAGIFPHETVYLYAVDAPTGRVLWRNDAISQADADRDDLSPQGYMLANEDTLFVPSGRSMPAAFDRATGEFSFKSHPAWRREAGGQVGGTQAMLADGQLYSVAEHHVLALDDEKGDTGFGWFDGRQMTLDGDLAYLANGEQVVAVNRLEYAEASRERHLLYPVIYGLENDLRKHQAVADLATLKKAQATLEQAKRAVEQLDKAGKKDGNDHKLAVESRTRRQLELENATAQYETSRSDYEKNREKLNGMKEQAAKLEIAGLKWQTPSPHESCLVLAGDTLVAGGVGEVVVFDTNTGEQVWKAPVDGEARGLAVSDGYLVVSTTEGNIYAFADATQKAPATVARAAKAGTADPFPKDDLSERYAAAAEQIIERSGVTDGFCLVLGSERGRLAYELARRTNLVIYGLESDAAKVEESRTLLAEAGIYGPRLTIDHLDVSIIPYAHYFANLVVSDTLLVTGEVPVDAALVADYIKPIGGTVCLGVPESATDAVKARANSTARQWLVDTNLADQQASITPDGSWAMLERGPLPGADDWNHQYGNPANTSSNEDQLVRGGLSVLWYGDPGPGKMINRHDGAVGPVSANGRLFVEGDESVMAYDAYNGQFLWEIENPGALRTGVFNNYEPGNLTASDDSVFVVVGDSCLHIDAATGEVVRTYTVPNSTNEEGRGWGYIAYKDGVLYGASTVRDLILEAARRRGRTAENAATDSIFAIDTGTGEFLWTYDGQSIAHTTIAVGDGQIYFIDSNLTPQQREELLNQDKTELAQLTGRERELAEERIKKLDLRRAVALDARTGDQLWAHAVDVTDCTGVGIGAGSLTLMYANNQIVLCGANANGHYWNQFLSGDFERRRLVVLGADSGEKIWAKDANYRHRPIIIGNQIIAEPWAFDLYTGEPIMTSHPLTGEQTPWSFARPGHHCGAISATPSMMFYRSGFTAYYDLEADSGTRHFAGHRLGCWINTIPANGLVMIPEASAGCVCLFSLAATVVFEPRAEHEAWGVYTAQGMKTPVKHMSLNLGGPGDRRDAYGTLWLSYPRPSAAKGLDLVTFDIQPKFAKGGGFYGHNSESVEITGTEDPWLFASGARGLDRCELPLIGPGEPAARYSVRLLFAADVDEGASQPAFDVMLQGRKVEEKLDVVATAGATGKVLVREYDGIDVTDNLLLEFVPQGDADGGLPVLQAIEVLRDDSDVAVK